MITTTNDSTPAVAHKARVLYDGHCALCRKSVELLRSFDWLKRLDYVDVRDASQPVLQNPLVAGAPLLDQMHVLTPNSTRIYGGFAAFRWMAWRLPLFFPIAPLLYVPGVPWVGDRIYKWVARNRFRLVPCHDGVCQIQRKDAS